MKIMASPFFAGAFLIAEIWTWKNLTWDIRTHEIRKRVLSDSLFGKMKFYGLLIFPHTEADNTLLWISCNWSYMFKCSINKISLRKLEWQEGYPDRGMVNLRMSGFRSSEDFLNQSVTRVHGCTREAQLSMDANCAVYVRKKYCYGNPQNFKSTNKESASLCLDIPCLRISPMALFWFVSSGILRRKTMKNE